MQYLRDYYCGLDHHMREIMRGAGTALFLKATGAGLTFAFNVILARSLGADGAGIYYLGLTVTTIATVFGRIGLDNTLLRFTAANASIEDWSALRGVYRRGVLLAVAASTTTSLVTFVAAPWFAANLFFKPELTIPLRWMALAVVPVALLNLHAEMLKGIKRIFASQMVQAVAVPALSLSGLYFLAPVLGIEGAALAYVLATGLAAAGGLWAWRVATPQLRGVVGRFRTRELLRSSFPLFWVATMNSVMTWTATFTLGIWGTSADVGVFGVASRTALLTSYALIAVNSIAAPKFAALYQQGEMDVLAATARKATSLMIVLASPILLSCILVPGWIMRVFGPEFQGGAGVLAILAVGQFVNVATGSVRYLLMMCGYERVVGVNFVVVTIMNIALCLILIPSAGVVGAAAATVATLITNNLSLAYHVWARLGIWTVPLGWRPTYPVSR